MRWSFGDQTGITPKELRLDLLKLISSGDSAAAAKARQQLEEAVAPLAEEPIPQPNVSDASGDERLIAYAYDEALLYALTADLKHAQRAATVLHAFAEVLPQRRLVDREGKSHAQDDAAYLRHWTANGFWKWHPLDLAEALPLLRAYDIIRPTLSDKESTALRENLFIYHKRLISSFTGIMPLYHNLAGYHLIPLIRYGQVLEQPDYISEAGKYWEEFLRYSYSVDGFFRELSPDYHRQITARIIGGIPALLKERAEALQRPELDVTIKYTAMLQRIGASMEPLAFPDGTLVNLEDSWPKKLRLEGDRDKGTAIGKAPGLLGASGVAKLGSDGMAAFLKFDGIRGHDHLDALGLVWFAAGMEIFSDTGYQPISGSGATRAWIASTAAHVTVAVDEAPHFRRRDRFAVPRRVAGVAAFPPAKPGSAPLEAAQPAAAGFANHGRLLVWDAEKGGIQAMEAEQERANPGTSLFRRAVVMVPVKGDEGYLLDLFRVEGGKTHDYFLRGGLDEKYSIVFQQPLGSASGTIYNHWQLRQRGAVRLPLEASLRFPERGIAITSRLSALYGSEGNLVEAVLAEAPAIRRTGLAPFSMIRHQSRSGKPLRSHFVWVHEVSRGASRILDVASREFEEGIVVRVQLEDREDWFFSGRDEHAVIRSADFEFQGRLATVSISGGKADARIHSGSYLKKAGEIIAQRPKPQRFKVVSTSCRDAGATRDAVLLQALEGETLDGYRLAHLDLGDAIRLSVPIIGTFSEEGLSGVELKHPPGFVIPGEGVIVMTHFPGWRIAGSATVQLE